jgi:hypothetical protein
MGGARYQPQLDINGPVAQETAVLASDTIRDSIDQDSAALLAPQRLDFQQRSGWKGQQPTGERGLLVMGLCSADCEMLISRGANEIACCGLIGDLISSASFATAFGAGQQGATGSHQVGKRPNVHRRRVSALLKLRQDFVFLSQGSGQF